MKVVLHPGVRSDLESILEWLGGSDIRVVALTRHPYRIFYRVARDAIQILHIRHTSRAPWEGGR
jgi:hypothetical protein